MNRRVTLPDWLVLWLQWVLAVSAIGILMSATIAFVALISLGSGLLLGGVIFGLAIGRVQRKMLIEYTSLQEVQKWCKFSLIGATSGCLVSIMLTISAIGLNKYFLPEELGRNGRSIVFFVSVVLGGAIFGGIQWRG